ncbi:MAG: FHA domain-containing protein, partial [Thermoplasmatota archaeon]
RLKLLRQLQRPQSLSEIRVSPSRKEGDDRPDRPMSRVTVRQHLEHLLRIGAVEQSMRQGPGRAVEEFTVVPSQLFVLAEEIMEVARVQRRTDENEQTRPLDGLKHRAGRGAGFLLVNGVHEGAWWPLEPVRLDGDAWTIGRAQACSIPLAFDPFVSTLHACVREEDGYQIEAEAGVRNPLLVDWRQVQPGERVDLSPGSVVTVGRSTLVFRT